MDWRDEAIVLSVRPHGETSAIVELLAKQHGRHLGLVRGGRSRHNRPVLQPGNTVDARWRARLSEHLGTYALELREPFAALALDDQLALAGVSTLTALARLLPERDPHVGVYQASLVVLQHVTDSAVWPGLLVRWELALLDELGFGLDLSRCAATGAVEDLAYVSPKSGRAVSRAGGEPYKEKLLPLPPFLSGRLTEEPSTATILEGFALTGHFLEKNVLVPRGLSMPEARSRLLGILGKARGLERSLSLG